MLKVLIVEDDLMIADMAEEMLVEHGYEVCGIARSVAEAVALGLRHQPDLAIIDLRLADGDLGTEVAAQLKALGRLGVLYATGNMAQIILTDGDACLAKPYSGPDLMRGLEIVAEIVASGERRRRFPADLRCCRRVRRAFQQSVPIRRVSAASGSALRPAASPVSSFRVCPS
jgi:CheY-like chemotaxis protein